MNFTRKNIIETLDVGKLRYQEDIKYIATYMGFKIYLDSNLEAGDFLLINTFESNQLEINFIIVSGPCKDGYEGLEEKIKEKISYYYSNIEKIMEIKNEF